MSEPFLPVRRSRPGSGRRFVYVSRSRRAGGISVGINLDPQKTCNFDCVYCEVIDRREVARGRGRPAIEAAAVADELREVLAELAGGPEPPRDIAFAGDGEPSTFPGFLDLSSRVFEERDRAGLPSLPVTLITNGSGLARAEMVEAHDLFSRRGGTFWIKLDAGTEPFYRAVCRTAVPFGRILANLRAAALRHPVVVQSMFFRWHAEPPGAAEIEAWASRIGNVVRAGGRIAVVQVYTVAREPMEPVVTPLSAAELEEIAGALRAAVPGVEVTVFP